MTLELTLARTGRMVALLAVLVSACPLSAADGAKPAADPFAEAFFSPELVTLARDRIALTANQEQTLRDCVEKRRRRAEELRAKLERETTALAALAKQPHVDEAAVGAQLDKVLDVEREAKHVHLGLLIAVKNLLTPQQQAQLRKIEAASKHVPGKIERVTEIAHAWEKEGRDTSSIAKAMDEKVRPLIEAGKLIEAEAELDRLSDQLQQGAK
jgi:Spy/CpxP family protein refolding chaperone